MRKSRFTEEQIAMALRQGEAGTPVAEIIRKLGVSEQTYDRWRKEFGGMKVDPAREFKDLQRENAQLKRAVANLTLDKLTPEEAAKGNF